MLRIQMHREALTAPSLRITAVGKQMAALAGQDMKRATMELGETPQ